MRSVAYLLEQGVRPSEFLAITFTKKASEGMKEKLAEILGSVPSGLTICTFHALGYQMLREHAALAGLAAPFDIVSSAQQQAILLELTGDLSVDGDMRKISRRR